jgi:uracil-DNA glycosylase
MTKFYYPIPEKGYRAETYNCEKCGIRNKRELETPNMKPVIGSKYDGFLIVTENLTKEDDRKGMPLMNKKAVEYFRLPCLKNRFNIVDNAAIVPLVGCQIGKVTDTYARCCFENFANKWITELKPKVIVTLGELPFKFIMHNATKLGAKKIRGRIIPNYYYNAVVMPVFNPNEIDSYHYRDALKWDLKKIIKKYQGKYNKRKEVNNFLERRKILENITIKEITSKEELVELFKTLNSLKEFSLDYETTNTKPYDDDFEIVLVQFGIKSIAWCIYENTFKPNWTYFKEQMKSLLLNPNIKKIIQNSKFEDLCSRRVFGIDYIRNTECTMLATHVIDERRGCTSLDFQNLVRFGIPAYSAKVKSLLKIKEEDDVIVKTNRVKEIKKEDLIQYGALDVITTFNNWKLLEKILPQKYPKAQENYEFLKSGHWAFANMSQRGITIDLNEQQRLISLFEKEMEKILIRILEIPEFAEFNEFIRKTKHPEKKSMESIREKLSKVSNGRIRNRLLKSNGGSDKSGSLSPIKRHRLQVIPNRPGR